MDANVQLIWTTRTRRGSYYPEINPLRPCMHANQLNNPKLISQELSPHAR